MLFVAKDCLDFKLFNEDGKEVFNMDYACKSDLRMTRDRCNYILKIDHELNDFRLFELVNGNTEERTDFDNEVGDIEIDFGMNINSNRYKAIGTFNVKMEDGTDKKVKLIFNNIKFHDEDTDTNRFKNDACNVSTYNTVFKIFLDEDKKFFRMKANV